MNDMEVQEQLASQAATASRKRGRFKVFFGAASGVGKTRAMLSAAQLKQAEGFDVVLAAIDTHGHRDLEELSSRFEMLAISTDAQRLASMIVRKPDILLLDDIAQANAPGATHPYRYQDIDDLLDHGIDVYGTLNVQELESMSDLVERITGSKPTSTVPDRFIEQADEIALVDIPADEILHRAESTNASPKKDLQATKTNLLALRELTLRATADRIDADLLKLRRVEQRSSIGVRERVLVCVGPQSEYLVRAAKRAATRLKADWIAVYVETANQLKRSQSSRAEIIDTLRLAERLGAETITLTAGHTFAEEVLELAHARNVTRIVVGKPHRQGWRRWLLGSIVDALVEGSGPIDIHVVGDDFREQDGEHAAELSPISSIGIASEPGLATTKKSRWRNYLTAGAIVALSTALAFAISPWFAPTNLAMVLLLGVVITATKFGRGPSMLSALLSVAAFDFFFVPPIYTFRFAEGQYLLSAAALLVVGIVISTLAANLKLQLSIATHRERRTASLYRMNREMAAASTLGHIAASASAHLLEVFDAKAVLLVDDGGALLHIDSTPNSEPIPWPADEAAQWVQQHGRIAGLATESYARSEFLYLPLIGSHASVGVLGVRPHDKRRFLIPEQLHLLEAFASQIALAVERERLTQHAKRAELIAQEETLRSSLLASISHDLRTPLATVTSTASTLLENDSLIDPVERRKLLATLNEESQRVAHVLTSLLEMTRLESPSVRLDRQWQMLEEIIGAALRRLKRPLASHPVRVAIGPQFPMIHVDGILFETLLVNLLENACKYTPEGTPIRIESACRDESLTIDVVDSGPGFPEDTARKLFEKFYRGQSEGSVTGAGLGLSICRAIAVAHGGTIEATNLSEGGARFRVTLPFIRPPLQESA